MFGKCWSVCGVVGLVSCCLVACATTKPNCKALQEEAVSGLRTLTQTMEKIKQDKGEYPNTMNDLEAVGFVSRAKNYDYKLTKILEDGFAATAVGKNAMLGDIWNVDQGGNPTSDINRCAEEAAKGCMAAQGEAKSGFTALAEAMEKIKAEKGEFPKTILELADAGFTGSTTNYDFKLTKVTDDSFSATAVGKKDMVGDIWNIAMGEEPVAVLDKCTETVE